MNRVFTGLLSLTVVEDVAFGSLHSVLLASNTHFDMWVPFDKLQAMNMKPIGKKPFNN